MLFTIVKEDGRYWLGFDRLRCLEIGVAGGGAHLVELTP